MANVGACPENSKTARPCAVESQTRTPVREGHRGAKSAAHSRPPTGQVGRRFRVRNLLISSVPAGGLLGDDKKVCAKNDPSTRVECVPDDDKKKNTVFACKAKSDTTARCGSNSDTTLDCGDAETYLPCLEADDTKPPCAKGVPDKASQTKYRCIDDSPEGEKTEVPCRGGTSTGVPGMPKAPWKGCLEGSKTVKQCADQFNTAKRCIERGEKKTTYACVETPGADTKTPCRIDSDTKQPCKQIDTRDCHWTCWAAYNTEFCNDGATSREFTPYAAAAAA
jgi:hypothetical protein